MENKSDNNNNQEKNQPEKKSWFERNLWLIAVCIAIFLLRMCNDLSR
ncbi:MAG: hypothetical protein NC453_28340 [Muribaculum sp.]|nr:hypothetical protein [Muribaculum sp.]